MSNQPITEKHGSRATNIKQGTATQSRLYTLRGYSDESAVITAVLAYAPAAVTVQALTMQVDDVDVRTLVAYDAAGAESLYECTVNYTTPDLQDKRPPVEPTDPELVSGDFASRTTYVQLADKQLNAYFHGHIDTQGTNATGKRARRSGWYTSESGIGDAAGKFAYPSYEGNQIGKDSRQSLPMGCEKNIAASTFSVTKVVAAATVTNAWLYARMSQVWTMNDSTFRDLAARTTMLTGMQSSQRASGDWDITYNFEFRPYVQMSLPSPKLPNAQLTGAGSYDTSGFDGNASTLQGYYNPIVSSTSHSGGRINEWVGSTGSQVEQNTFFNYADSDIIVPPANNQQTYFEFSAWDYFYLKTRQADTEVAIGDFGDGINAGASGYTNAQKSSLTASGFSISRIYKETSFALLGIGT